MEYTIKSTNASLSARTLGGELLSYKKDGKEYVWTGDENFWTGHAPGLFPFVSSLKDGKVEIAGEMYYSKPKHGFLRTSEMELVEKTETSMTFELHENEETKKIYPYDFAFLQTHTLTEDGFTTTFTVKNTDSRDIEFCLGGHPGFLLEDGVENYDLVFEQEENCDVYHTNADSLFSYDFKVDRRLEGNKWTLKHSDFDTLDALFFNDAKSKKVSLVRKDGTKHLTFDFNGFDVLVIWTMPGKKAPYLCLEPWNGLPALTDESGKFSDKPYLRTLKPGEEYSVSYNVKV